MKEFEGDFGMNDNSNPVIYCNSRPIGQGHSPFIIAEAGVHHNCSLDKAFALVDAAVDAGVDAIKFQTYRAEKLVTTWAPRYWDCGEAPGTQFDTFKERDKFGFEEYKRIANYCRDKGIVFLSTPFDEGVVDWLEELKMPLYKVASADLTHYPLLKRIAITGKPVLLSVGASEKSEIEAAIAWLRQHGTTKISLLHCSLCYPTENNQAHIRKILGLQRAFSDCVIGYSDHTIPDEAVSVLLGSVALGASVIETHFTLDRSLPEDDHYHALDPLFMKRFVDGSKIIHQALGSEAVVVHECEIPARQNARRSIVAAVPLRAGTVLQLKHVDCKRPGTGTSPIHLSRMLGRTLRVDIAADGLLLEEQFE